MLSINIFPDIFKLKGEKNSVVFMNRTQINIHYNGYNSKSIIIALKIMKILTLKY